MPIETIVPESDKSLYNNFHFAPAVRSGNLLICSGVIGSGGDGKVPEAAADEFRLAWQGVGQVLEEAGLNYDNIVEYTTFHVGLNAHLADFMKVRDEFLSEPWPAWTAIGVTELAVRGGRVEIRVIAEK
jgi:enamine deaminase RidA (YjgF/YER057c/UK114 family)